MSKAGRGHRHRPSRVTTSHHGVPQAGRSSRFHLLRTRSGGVLRRGRVHGAADALRDVPFASTVRSIDALHPLRLRQRAGRNRRRPATRQLHQPETPHHHLSRLAVLPRTAAPTSRSMGRRGLTACLSRSLRDVPRAPLKSPRSGPRTCQNGGRRLVSAPRPHHAGSRMHPRVQWAGGKDAG